MLPAEAFALTNADDKVGEVMLQNTRAHRYTYSLRSDADFRGRIVESRLGGTLLSLNGNEVELLFPESSMPIILQPSMALVC